MKKQIEVVKKVWEPYKKIMQIKEKKTWGGSLLIWTSFHPSFVMYSIILGKGPHYIARPYFLWQKNDV